MQLVQTRIRLLPPPTFAFTGRRFTFQRRRLMLCAWEMLLPNCGPLPQTSQTCAITKLQKLDWKPVRGGCVIAGTARRESPRAHNDANQDRFASLQCTPEPPPSQLAAHLDTGSELTHYTVRNIDWQQHGER